MVQRIRLNYGESYGAEIQSVSGAGTKVHLTLPVLESGYGEHMIRVVIIEDEMLVRIGLKMCITEYDPQLKVVADFSSAEEALEYFEKKYSGHTCDRYPSQWHERPGAAP